MKRSIIIIPVLVAIIFVGCSNSSNGQCQAGDGKTVTTAAGVTYAELQVCGGTAVAEGNKITVNYVDYLKDGDQAHQLQNVQGLVFQVGAGQVIRGLDSGVVGMKVGGKRRLTLTPDLAYGAKGDLSNRIPGNATLIYEVELVSIAH